MPPILVNWHHDYFLEVTMLHTSEVPEDMKLPKVRLVCKAQSDVADRFGTSLCTYVRTQLCGLVPQGMLCYFQGLGFCTSWYAVLFLGFRVLYLMVCCAIFVA